MSDHVLQKITHLTISNFPGLAVVDNLRTRLLALHLLERILPAAQSMQEGEQVQQYYYCDL